MAGTVSQIWKIHSHIHKCNCSSLATVAQYSTVLLHCDTLPALTHCHLCDKTNLLLALFGTFAGLETCSQVSSLVCEEAFEVQGTSLFPDSLAPTKGRTNRKQQVSCGKISTYRSGLKSACRNINICKVAMEQGLPFMSHPTQCCFWKGKGCITFAWSAFCPIHKLRTSSRRQL